jgi:hypothetical protein
MLTELNQYNNDITTLTPLTEFNYENIFKVFQDGNYYSFNILKKVNFPENLDEQYFDYIEVSAKMSWTNMSYKEYGTMFLWWLICAANKIQNPIVMPTSGTILKVIKPQYVRLILDNIKSQLNT